MVNFEKKKLQNLRWFVWIEWLALKPSVKVVVEGGSNKIFKIHEDRWEFK